MKTRNLLVGLIILLATMLTSCKDRIQEPDVLRKYRVEIEIAGEGNGTMGILSFTILKDKGQYVDNDTYIQITDIIEGKQSKLNSFTNLHLVTGRYSFEAIAEHIMIVGGVTNTDNSVSTIKATVYENNREIYTKTLSTEDPVKQFIYNTSN
jgi:lipoprotein